MHVNECFYDGVLKHSKSDIEEWHLNMFSDDANERAVSFECEKRKWSIAFFGNVFIYLFNAVFMYSSLRYSCILFTHVFIYFDASDVFCGEMSGHFFSPHFSLFEPNNKRYEGCREGSLCLRITRLFFRIPLWRQMTVFRALLVHIVGGCRAFKIRAWWLTMSWT